MSNWCEKCGKSIPDSEVIESLQAENARLTDEYKTLQEELGNPPIDWEVLKADNKSLQAENQKLHDAMVILSLNQADAEHKAALQAQVQRLKSELTEVKREAKDNRSDAEHYFKWLGEVQAELAECKKDVARYRFIRNGNKRFDGQRSNEDYLYGDQLDAVIDSAMKEQS